MSCPDEMNPDDESLPAALPVVQMVVKLVLLPGTVVFVLVMIMVGFGWLTLSPGDVDSVMASLGKGGNERWRAAVNLAGMLQDPTHQSRKKDPVLAMQLAEILQQELDAGGMDDQQITLRMYLCRALGEFHVADVLPVLVEAAGTERDKREADVRRSAIEAIAVLASNVGRVKLRSQPELVATLIEAAQDQPAPLRSTAAFTLGVVGGNEAEARLETMLTDGHPDVRYNAATGLARYGNVKVIDVLLEMLDPNESAGIEVEKQQPARASKRTTILVNALEATRQLSAANPTADISRLAEAVRRLAQGNVPDTGIEEEEKVRLKAAAVLEALGRRTAPAS